MNMHSFVRGTPINKARVPLSNDEIMRVAPSVFAERPYHAMSDRYAFVPTIQVIEGMRSAGFFPVSVTQSRARLEDKREFTKHMIRFQNQSVALRVGDTLIESWLVNAHDGSASYIAGIGAFRLACSNGLMVSEGMLGEIRIKHIGDIIGEVVNQTSGLLQRAPIVGEAIQRWKTIDLSVPEQKALAMAAHVTRFGPTETAEEKEANPLALAIPSDRLLTARRADDNGSDLWSVFNRVQENTVKGGVRGYDAAQRRRVRSREVKGIDQNNNLNKALWQLAQFMADEKTKVA